ncbi:MAG: ATP-binding protein [Sinobacterium sp.]|jgi:two-component system sensor histidine kinase CpxA|uniref:ATP-binding protein n=1 Tax=uncultured Paraglaciecola sp. TaxID=1765024 RepID=UPI00260D12CE|nr:ATP-binding protein [uncultured Paraglaciecola sp.]|tara:strand:+ start:321 stop:551 length:231 start_codon:yes stop_codon:yes gene_type:complete
MTEDDGIGIDENQLSRICEAFYRESTARDRNSGGVGFGLAIAKHAINKHIGFIQASTTRPKVDCLLKYPYLSQSHE